MNDCQDEHLFAESESHKAAMAVRQLMCAVTELSKLEKHQSMRDLLSLDLPDMESANAVLAIIIRNVTGVSK